MRFFGLVSIPHVLRDTTDEVFRLIGRIVRHGEHAACLHIDAHERCRGSCSTLHELAQRRIGDILHWSGDREVDVAPLAGSDSLTTCWISPEASVMNVRQSASPKGHRHKTVSMPAFADRVTHLDIASFSNILQIFFR